MALLKIGNTNMLNTLNRVSRPAAVAMRCAMPATARHREQLHLTSVRRYPEPPTLALPVNVCDIFANETGRFTPERSRDIALYSENGGSAVAANQSGFPRIRDDGHVDSYDCFGAVSLNGTMQSNVPTPFSSRGKSTHLNMPGGQLARNGKYIAEDMQRSHYRKLRPEPCFAINPLVMSSLSRATYRPICIVGMAYSTDASSGTPKDGVKDQSLPFAMSKKERFRIMLRDYGGTLLAFHITFSLLCLGGCYMIVVSGVDVMPLVQKVTGGNEQVDAIMKTSTDFVIAYTVHKLFAPVRISVTLTVTPLLVRYLRRIGLLKMPKVNSPSSR